MVYIKTLKKEIFPCYLPPAKEELFTSWLCRLAFKHGVKTNTFILNYLGRDFPFWTRDIDVFAPQKIIDILIKHTPLSQKQINNLFIRSYETYAYEKHSVKGYTQNILPIGINHRKRTAFGQQCCTSCLSKGISYYKKSWRLCTSVICSECNQILIDRCFNCGSPIAYGRINIVSESNRSNLKFKPLYLCYHCETDLRKHYPNRTPTKTELEYQKHIDLTIRNGYNDITQYSFIYIRLLFILAIRLMSGAKNNRFRHITQRRFNITSEINKQLRFWEINERLFVFPKIYSLLKDYPTTIQEIFKEGNINRYNIVKDKYYVPYLLINALQY